jgi:hypothetical protein
LVGEDPSIPSPTGVESPGDAGRITGEAGGSPSPGELGAPSVRVAEESICAWTNGSRAGCGPAALADTANPPGIPLASATTGDAAEAESPTGWRPDEGDAPSGVDDSEA